MSSLVDTVLKVIDDHSEHPYLRWPMSNARIPCKGGGCYKGWPHDIREELEEALKPFTCNHEWMGEPTKCIKCDTLMGPVTLMN